MLNKNYHPQRIVLVSRLSVGHCIRRLVFEREHATFWGMAGDWDSLTFLLISESIFCFHSPDGRPGVYRQPNNDLLLATFRTKQYMDEDQL